MDNECSTLRDCVALFAKKRADGQHELAFLFQSSRILASFEASALTLECIRLFDGNHTLCEIAKTVGVPQEKLHNLVEHLKAENIIEEKRDLHNMNGRYRRQLNFFSSFESEEIRRDAFQKRIEYSHVVVLGAGGIGTWLIESLIRSGVGELTIIDPDFVELSNLSRQGFFLEQDAGRSKAEVIKERAYSINSSTKVNTEKKLIRSADELSAYIEPASLAINCSDYQDVTTTNKIVSYACFQHRTPHILCGGYDGHLSFVGQTVIPFKTSCWECYTNGMIYEKALDGFEHIPITASSIEGGTLASIANVTANIHAVEALKVISGYAEPAMANHKGEFDFLSLSLQKTYIPKIENCPLCSDTRAGGNQQ